MRDNFFHFFNIMGQFCDDFNENLRWHYALWHDVHFNMLKLFFYFKNCKFLLIYRVCWPTYKSQYSK